MKVVMSAYGTDGDVLPLLRVGGEMAASGHDVTAVVPPGHAGRLPLGVTLVETADPGYRLLCEEIFGPVAGVIRVKNYDEALAVARDDVDEGALLAPLDGLRRHDDGIVLYLNEETRIDELVGEKLIVPVRELSF